MRHWILKAALLGAFLVSPACKTDAASEVKAVTEGGLLKWRVGRYALVKPAKNGEPNEQKTSDGTVACSITTEDVRKQLGEAKLASLEKAIGDVWQVRDKRQTSPIFRPLLQSRELVATDLGRQDICPGCRRDTRVCKNCDFFDPSVNNQCRENQAERVVDKEKSNFCDYFRPSNRKGGQGKSADALKAAADALFKKRS